jgi:hypothetical protein
MISEEAGKITYKRKQRIRKERERSLTQVRKGGLKRAGFFLR